MPLHLSEKIAPGYEPISGYTLEQKIGEGGFGEVWRCNAPGDIKKAVKFVFGANDAKRGERELKSLERIKGVHHPFLLTLERFGVVDNQLVIVTELADGSLEDVLKRHVDRGSCGIPRASLLSYLHDAADALDYLHQSYQLQHLDVKPGNLLMVGGHVKVGDFGLLKDLRENDHSIVSGLTPIYAPPEVFDGRPSMNSDQYSLAVMYQELLTGTRPFEGRTIAQLATQHVHASPNLEPLPHADRVAVAQALEKNPERRFASCKEFVDALRTPRTKPEKVVTRSKPNIESADVAVEDLPSLHAGTQIHNSRVTGHAMVVAIGGVGAECLHELRGRVATLHSACPLDLHSVLIDTDIQTIHAARLTEASDRIPPATILHTPLRSAQEYRSGSTDHLKSISRRWLYNVPRSGSTEGMRPLGRLAMVDHAQKIDDGLREAIDHLAAVAGDRVPSVYVVGSLSGGTASGMMLDIAPRLRHLLDEAGLEHASILPLFSSVSLQGNPHQPVTLHDTHSAISELQHYMQSGNSYPGDPGIGWAGIPAVRNPLRNAYVVLDGGSSSEQFVSASSTIVDYLWADATGAGELLAAARKCELPDAQSHTVPMLRSVGVSRLKCLRALEENLLAPAAARHLLLRWLGRPAESREIAGPLAERLLKRCNLDQDAIANEIVKSFGETPDDVVDSIARIIEPLSDDDMGNPKVIERLLLLALDKQDIASRLQRINATRLVSLRRELSVRLHDGRIDVTSATQAVNRLIDICRDLAATVTENDPVSTDADDQSHVSSDALSYQIEACHKLAMQELDQITSQLVANAFTQFANSLETLHTQLTEIAIGIARAVRCVPGDSRDTENPWEEMPQEIQSRFEPVLDNLHKTTASRWLISRLREPDVRRDPREMATDLVANCLPVVEDIIDANRASEQATSGSSTTSSNLTVSRSAQILAETKQLVADVGAVTGAQSVIDTQTIETNAGQRKRWSEQITAESALEFAYPQLLRCGGRQRLILLVGSESEQERLEAKIIAAHNGSLTTVVIPGIAPVLIHEAQQIQIDEVLKRFEIVSGGDTQVSRRLHSRNDVSWTSRTGVTA